MKQIYFLLAIFVSLAVVSCGGGGGSSSTPAPTPTISCLSCTTSIVLDGTVSTVKSQPLTQASGGLVTVTNSDSAAVSGTSITIPAASLPADTTVTVKQVTGSTLVPSDQMLTEIGPVGTPLSTTAPATVTVKYNPAYLTDNAISNNTTLKVVAYNNNVAPKTLGQSAPIDTTNKLVTAHTTELGRFAVLGYNNATLKGYYRIVAYHFNRGQNSLSAPTVGATLPKPLGFESAEVVMHYDGAGNFTTSTGTDNVDGTITSIAAGRCAGTYTIVPDGTVTTTPSTSNCSPMVGQVLAGGSTFIVSNQTSGQDPNLVIGIQQVASTNYSTSNLTGSFNAIVVAAIDKSVNQGMAPAVGSPLPAIQGLQSETAIVTFDGAGHYTGTGSIYENGVSSPDNFSSTYVVAADGSINLGGNVTGQILAGGSAILASHQGSGVMPTLIIWVKQPSGSFSNASLTGKYTVALYGYDHTVTQGNMPNPGTALPPPNGFTGKLLTVTFDGTGNFTSTGSINVDGNIASVTPSGTYTVSGSGAFKLSTGLAGQLLEDGSTFVLGTGTSGIMSQIGVGLIR